MRFLTTLLIGSLLAVPAMAQTTPAATAPVTANPATPVTPKPAMKHTAMRKPMPHHMAARTGHTGYATPDDKGPFTPEANRAYDGGGAVLVGQPGGPPPPASAVIGQPTGRPLP